MSSDILNTERAELPNLPTQKRLAQLAELPVVVVDTREQTPLTFTRLDSKVATLQTGDYSFVGGEEHLAIERKSIPDLVACCMGQNRERFFRELHRMRGFPFRRLLVVGTRHEIETGQYRSTLNPRSVLSTLAAVEVRFDVPVVFAASPDQASWQVEEWVAWYSRELVLSANRILQGTDGR